MSALPSMRVRVRTAIRPLTHREVRSSRGNSSRHSTVTCQLSTSIVMPTTTTDTMLETVPDRVEVKALCAPITSEFSRLTSAPVWVRVKNASDWR